MPNIGTTSLRRRAIDHLTNGSFKENSFFLFNRLRIGSELIEIDPHASLEGLQVTEQAIGQSGAILIGVDRTFK